MSSVFKIIPLLMLPFFGSSLYVFAKPPRPPRLMDYARLWTASPFTIVKPVIHTQTSSTPLEREWSLGSIRPGKSGYSVTLINKKNRKNRIRFIPGFSSGEFKLLEVRQNAQNPKKSKVYVSRGGQKAWIGYDAKIVKLHIGRKSGSNIKRGKKVHYGKRTNLPLQPPTPVQSGANNKLLPRVRYVPRH